MKNCFKFLFIGVLPLILTGCCCCCTGGSSSSSEGSIDLQSQVMCRQEVRTHLKAPSTANFSGDSVSNEPSSNGGQRYVVTGYVDAENSFGAKLTNNYTCTYDYNSSTDEYKLSNFELN